MTVKVVPVAERDILLRLQHLAEVRRHFHDTLYADAAAEIAKLRKALEPYKHCRHACVSCFCTKEAIAALPAELENFACASFKPDPDSKFCAECGYLPRDHRRAPSAKGDAP